jgi:hypothetical protein
MERLVVQAVRAVCEKFEPAFEVLPFVVCGNPKRLDPDMVRWTLSSQVVFLLRLRLSPS